MEFRKGMSLATIFFGVLPWVAGADTFAFPDLLIKKGARIAWSLCDNSDKLALVPEGHLPEGVDCTPPGVQAGCPPYKFREANALDQLPLDANLHALLPIGLHISTSGVLYGTLKSISSLKQIQGVICMEDSCGHPPSCKQLRLDPVTTDSARLVEDRDVSPAGPAQQTGDGTVKNAAPNNPPAPGTTPGVNEKAAKKGGGLSTGLKVALATVAVVGIAGTLAASAAGSNSSGGGGGSGMCSNDSDCGPFGSRNCLAPGGGTCGPDSFCYCCAAINSAGFFCLDCGHCLGANEECNARDNRCIDLTTRGVTTQMIGRAVPVPKP